MSKSSQNSLPFILPAVAWIAILTMLPLAYLIYLSFIDYRLIRPGQEFVGIENYQRLFSDGIFLEAFPRTVFFAVSSTAITLLLGTVAAWVFSYDLPGIRFLRSVFTTPLFTASVAVAVIARFLFSPMIGLFPDRPILSDSDLAGFALIAVDAWQWTPLVFVVVLNALRNIPAAEYDSARLDTKSDAAIFSVVAFPRVRRALLLVALLRLIGSLQMFDLPYVMTGGGPIDSTQTMALAIFDVALRAFRLGYAAALSVVLLILIAVISFAFFRLLSKRFTVALASQRASLQSYLEALRSS